jgi:3-deoxy-D-manno-octulosonic-acid transferase
LLVYNLTLLLLTPVLLLLTLYQARRRDGGLHYIKERFGFFTAEDTQTTYWFHGASVGEIQLVLSLLPATGQERVLLTCNTPEALRLAKEQVDPRVVVHFCPIDFLWPMGRLVRHYRPKYLFIVETELWPQLFATASANRVEIRIVNGRVGAKTADAPAFLKPLYRQMLRQVGHIWARDPIDRDRFIGLGCPEDRISTAGNLKLSRPAGIAPHYEPVSPRPFSLAISTHEGEEATIIGAWKSAGQSTLLVVIPRHPPRAAGIAKSLIDQNIVCHLHSEKKTPQPTTEVYLVDTIGEVGAFCAQSDFVFVGGSLVPVGGHNLMEPAALGKAILSGPHTQNFESMVSYLLENNAMVIASTEEKLKEQWRQLSDNSTTRDQLGVAASIAVDKLPDRVQFYRDEISSLPL